MKSSPSMLATKSKLIKTLFSLKKVRPRALVRDRGSRLRVSGNVYITEDGAGREGFLEEAEIRLGLGLRKVWPT